MSTLKARAVWPLTFAVAAPLSLLYLTLIFLPWSALVLAPVVFGTLCVLTGMLSVSLAPESAPRIAFVSALTAALLAYGAMFVIALINARGPLAFRIPDIGKLLGPKTGGLSNTLGKSEPVPSVGYTLLVLALVLSVSLVFGAVSGALATLIRERRRRSPKPAAAVWSEARTARFTAVAGILGALISAIATVIVAFGGK